MWQNNMEQTEWECNRKEIVLCERTSTTKYVECRWIDNLVREENKSNSIWMVCSQEVGFIGNCGEEQLKEVAGVGGEMQSGEKEGL